MEELNVNPNEPVSTNPDFLFTYSVVKGMGSYQTNVQFHYWNLMNWNMYLATLKGVDAGKEYETSDGKNNLWNEMYSQSLINAKEVITLTENNPELSNKTNIARIWKAFIFQRTTDLWGNIPYAEALQGSETGNFKPVYDSQESIYLNLISELKSAASNLDQSKISFKGTTDPLYGGNILLWRAFANSLRMRLALRLTSVNPMIAEQEINELSTATLISSNSENAFFPYNENIKNPLYEVLLKGEGAGKMYPSKFLVDMLNITADPRLKIFAKPTLESQVIGFDIYDGVPNLLPSSSPSWNAYYSNGTNVSTVGGWFQRASSPGMLLSYAEVCFMKAEGALYGWFPGDAAQYYKDGVRANMQSYSDSISQADIDTYVNNLPPVSLQHIITQKWLSFTFQNGYEAYAEYRRTGFPVLKDFNQLPVNEITFPKRITYPFTESTLNTINYLASNAAQGPDMPSTKVWWDKN